MLNFKALDFSTQNVGKRIKKTKKKLSWTFELEGKAHLLEMYISKLSSKIKIILDGDIKVDTKRNPDVIGNYSIHVRTRTVHVYQTEEHEYDISVGKISFYKLMKEKQLEEERKNKRNQPVKEKGRFGDKSAEEKAPFRSVSRSSGDEDPKLPENITVPQQQMKKSYLEDLDLLDMTDKMSTHENPQQNSQTTNQGMFFMMPQVMTQMMPQGMNQGMMPQGMNQGMMPQGMNQGIPQGMNQGMMPLGMPQGIPQGMMPQGMNQEIPQTIQQGIPQNSQIQPYMYSPMISYNQFMTTGEQLHRNNPFNNHNYH